MQNMIYSIKKKAKKRVNELKRGVSSKCRVRQTEKFVERVNIGREKGSRFLISTVDRKSISLIGMRSVTDRIIALQMKIENAI